MTPILSTIFEISNYNNWFAFDDSIVLSGSRVELVVDLMKIPGFEDIFGLLFQGHQMTIFRDVLVENGVMWYELKEFKADYLKQQKQRLNGQTKLNLYGLRIALIETKMNKRSFLALAKYLKSQGACVGLFVERMKMNEYLRITKDFEVYCPEILL